MSFVNIETKEDSAEKLAQAAGKPTKNFLFAPEFNLLKNKVNEFYEAFILALNVKKNNAVYITANTTAINNANYIANGTFTVSDIISPVAGSNYEVVVRGGSVTVGGQAYSEGVVIQRIHNGTSWATIVLNQFNVLTVTSSVDIATSVEWNNRHITIDNGANNINIITNNQLFFTGNKNGGSGVVTFQNGSVTNVLVNGISTLTGIYDTFSIIPRAGFATNLLYISRQ